MNDPKKIEDLENQFRDLKEETNHNLTLLLGQSWKYGEQLKVIKSQLERVDDRVTEAHKELGEMRVEFNQKLDKILVLLQKNDTNAS